MLKTVIILNILSEHIATVKCYLWIAKDSFYTSEEFSQFLSAFTVTFSFIIIFCTEKDDKDVEI